MAFSLNSIKDDVSAFYRSQKPLLKRAGANALYGVLALGALMPIAAAAKQGGWAVGAEVSLLIGGVGVNLISNLLQRGKDTVDAQLAREVQAKISQEPELREKLDAILTELKAVDAAVLALDEADRQDFTANLDTAVKQVGSQLTITVGDIHHNTNSPILMGAGTQTTTYNIDTLTVHNGPDPEAEKSKARKRYLAHLRKFCQSLPLAALGGDEGSELGVSLDDVYIELDTTTSLDDQGRPDHRSAKRPEPDENLPGWLSGSGEKKKLLPVLRAAGENPRMVLLGDPGAGKSTFVRKLVGWLAGAVLSDGASPEGFTRDGLPLLINLRDLAPRLDDEKLAALPEQKQHHERIKAFMEQVQAELQLAEAESLQSELLQGLSKKGLLVLDGLDEVPFSLRSSIRRVVLSILQEYEPVRVIITCRIRSYQDDFGKADFKTFTVAPLNKNQIQGFASAWYRRQRDLGRTVPEHAEDDLAQVAAGPALRELSSNPMMLTTMAIIHQKQTRLPDQRVKLYKEAVDILLRRWQQHKQGALTPSPALTRFLEDENRLRSSMYRLAYEAHCARCQDKKNQTADLPRGEALVILGDVKYIGDLNLAQEFLDYVDQRAGLLVGRGSKDGAPALYSFPHRTFQEYLAACHILDIRDYNREILARAAEGVDWSLVIQLAAEALYYNREGRNALLDLAYWLRQHSSMESSQYQRVGLWSANQTLILGSAVTEDGTAGREHLEKLPTLMVNLLGSDLTPIERTEAGNHLARLGDPRFRADAFYLPDEPLQGFIHIPAGRFTMGSDKKKDPQADDDERPQHEVELGEYYIARYPVTVAQFKAFIETSKHKPRDPDSLRGLPNHPVVNVTWYDALAYCDWLTTQLPKLPNLPPELKRGWRVALPSEAEWERAVRGTDGRIYPWGPEFDPNKTNVDATGIGGTSAVGCFPAGVSPEGLLDASGNVWEWTRSLWAGYPYPVPGSQRKARERFTSDNKDGMVMRGGSWVNESGGARCASRDWFYPDFGGLLRGFRVSLSPL